MELAGATVGLGEVLVRVLEAALLAIKLGFELAGALLQLGDDLTRVTVIFDAVCPKLPYLLASLERGGFGFVEADLRLLQLLLESLKMVSLRCFVLLPYLAETLVVRRVLLLLAQLLSQPVRGYGKYGQLQ